MTRRPSKLLRMTVAAMATVLALGACAGGDGPRNTDSKRLTLGHGAAPGNPRSEGALEFYHENNQWLLEIDGVGGLFIGRSAWTPEGYIENLRLAHEVVSREH